jgi:catalase
MPLPDDEKIVTLANRLLAQFDAIFGQHPGFRPAHAKGAMLQGIFTPTEQAKSLSRAPHFRRESTPVTVRFSNSTGVPMIPDNDASANPRGIAIRFHLADRVHTDIVAHSTDFSRRSRAQTFPSHHPIPSSNSSAPTLPLSPLCRHPSLRRPALPVKLTSASRP